MVDQVDEAHGVRDVRPEGVQRLADRLPVVPGREAVASAHRPAGGQREAEGVDCPPMRDDLDALLAWSQRAHERRMARQARRLSTGPGGRVDGTGPGPAR